MQDCFGDMHPDAVILDLSLEESDGIEVLREYDEFIYRESNLVERLFQKLKTIDKLPLVMKD